MMQIETSKYVPLFYLLDSASSAIGWFRGPYSKVRLTKSKTLFLGALFQDKEV